jgi:hypothetical protein
VFNASIPAFAQNLSATYSPVTANGTTNVDASFGAQLRLTPPGSVSLGALSLGGSVTTTSLNVQSNSNYEVDVFDNTISPTVTGWHMTAWNGSAFVAPYTHLTDPLHVVSSQHDVTAGTPPTFITGGVAGQSGNSGQTWSFTVSQNTVYADPALPAGQTYHLILTWQAFVTL